MKRVQKSWLLVAVLLLIASGSFAVGQTPVGSSFTYQGKLDDAGQPADGTYNMEFRLFGAAVGGSQIGSTENITNIPVVDGKFTVELDFGADAFDGDARWLQVEVDNIVLVPRQSITAAPYSTATRGINVNDDASFVGIGRDSPLAATEVFGIYDDTSGLGGMNVETGPGGTPYYGYASGGIVDAQHFVDGSTGNWKLNVNGADRIAVNASNGFVGIGRDNRVNSAEIFGLYSSATSGFRGMYVQTLGENAQPFYGYAAGGSPDVYHYYEGATGNWRLWNAGERISVSNDGYVGIGRDTPVVPNNSYFDVQTPAGNNQFGGMHMATDGEGGIPFYGYAAGGTTDAFTYFNGGTRTWGLKTLGIERMTVTSNGRIGISTFTPGFLLEVNGSAGKPGGGSWSSSSDRRLKKNVEELDGSLEKLMKLRGVTYEYIDPKAINELEGERIGVIAQEVEKVFPDWVHQRDDGYKAVTFRGFEALTVEALRELRSEKDQQIETLEAENDELRERLETLEASVIRMMTNQ